MAQHAISSALNWLWQTTWQSALLAAAVMLVTFAFRRKLSPGAVQLLWMLVFLRLLMPVLPGSPLSVFSLLKPPTPQAVQRNMLQPSNVIVQTSAMRLGTELPSPGESHLLQNTLLAVWMAGVLVLPGWVVVSTMRFSRRLCRTAEACDPATRALVRQCCEQRKVRAPEILLTDLVRTPAIFGVICPRLLLPPQVLTELDAASLRSILLHEIEHLRRRHLLMDWLLTIVKAVHWFNPAAWWAHRRIRNARELICDQAVVARLDDENSRRYGAAMLNIAGSLGNGAGSVPMAAFARDYKLLRQRIELIAAGKRRYLAGFGLVLSAILLVLFMTTPTPAPAQQSAAPTTAPTEQRTYTGATTIRYPDNWPTTQPQKNPANSVAAAKMQRKVPEIRFDALPFSDAIDFMRDMSGANIVVIWQAIEQAGIERTAPVTVRLRDVSFAKALDTILRDVAGDKDLLDYTVDRGVITISTKKIIDAQNAAILDKKLAEVRFDRLPVGDVIEFLRQVSGANIVVIWRAVEAAGVDSTTPVTARLRDVKLSQALDTILHDASGDQDLLGYTVDQGVITISTKKDLGLIPTTQSGNAMPAPIKVDLAGVDFNALQIDVQLQILHVPRAKAAELFMPDPKTDIALLEDQQFAALSNAGITLDAATHLTLANGESSATQFGAPVNASIDLQTTLSANRQYVTASLQGSRENQTGQPRVERFVGFTYSILNGTTALMKLNETLFSRRTDGLAVPTPAASDQEIWIAIRPEIKIRPEPTPADLPALPAKAP